MPLEWYHNIHNVGGGCHVCTESSASWAGSPESLLDWPTFSRHCQRWRSSGRLPRSWLKKGKPHVTTIYNAHVAHSISCVCVWHLVMLADANENAYSRLSCTYVAVWFGGLCRKTTEHLMIVKEDVELAIHKLGFVVRSRVCLHASTWQVQYSFPKNSCLVSVLTQPTLGAELWNKRWVQESKQPSERRGCPSCASPWWTAAGANGNMAEVVRPKLWTVSRCERMRTYALRMKEIIMTTFWIFLALANMAIVGNCLNMSPKENLQKPQGTCCRVASIQPTMARPSLLSCPWPQGLLADQLRFAKESVDLTASAINGNQNKQITKFDRIFKIWRICELFITFYNQNLRIVQPKFAWLQTLESLMGQPGSSRFDAHVRKSWLTGSTYVKMQVPSLACFNMSQHVSTTSQPRLPFQNSSWPMTFAMTRYHSSSLPSRHPVDSKEWWPVAPHHSWWSSAFSAACHSAWKKDHDIPMTGQNQP